MRLTEYTRELHKAIESLEKGNIGDAELWLSNYYYKKVRSKQNNFVRVLQWTMMDEKFQAANAFIRGRIAKFYYFNDTSVNNAANTVFVKRTKNGYEIVEQKRSA